MDHIDGKICITRTGMSTCHMFICAMYARVLVSYHISVEVGSEFMIHNKFVFM